MKSNTWKMQILCEPEIKRRILQSKTRVGDGDVLWIGRMDPKRRPKKNVVSGKVGLPAKEFQNNTVGKEKNRKNQEMYGCRGDRYN